MLFNSTEFLVFLPLVVALCFSLKPEHRRYLLLVASYYFYGSWDYRFLSLLVISTLVDFSVGLLLDRSASAAARKALLTVSVCVNLGLLGFFKYFNFFADSLQTALEPVGVELGWTTLHIILPVGISFYTFQTMSYTIDVYRRQLKPSRNILEFALYVSFFPQLVAGPIERATRLLGQLTPSHMRFNWDNLRIGVARIIFGMVKKVYVADAMAHYVNEAYGDPGSFSGIGLLLATYAFAVQIYCDFSGYSDIAIGTAKIFNVDLMENFRSPYLSLSIREFWRRWHISLSTWLRDYLYIPLGGNRHGTARTYVNLMITMVLGGLWHGAGWNWVIWGAIQGGVMSAERAAGMPEEHPGSLAMKLLRWFVTFHIVCLSWVFFRSHGVGEAGEILWRILTFAPGALDTGPRPLIYLGLLIAAELVALKSLWIDFVSERPVLVRWAAYAATVIFALTFAGSGNPEFIYFQF